MASQANSPADTSTSTSTSISDPTPASTDQTSCWECSRRRLVCDAARPTCAKCRAAGIVCPGYSDKKPLRWLAPGVVTSRVRRKTKRKTVGAPAPGSTKTTHHTPPAETAGSSCSDSLGLSGGGGSSGLVLLSNGGSSAGQGPELIYQQGVRLNWGVPRGIPRAEFIFEETDILQATYYYNCQVFPEYIHHQLAPTTFVVPLPLETVALIPPAMSHILVSVALRHRMYRVGANSGRRDGAVLEMRSKYYHHRGMAIAALNAEIRKPGMGNAFLVMVNAIMFVFAELQQSNSSAWKYHMDAMIGMVARAGGLTRICRIAEQMKNTMVLFIMMHVTGSTTSPPSASTLTQGELADMLGFVTDVWEETPYPTFLCPTDVFVVIMRINHLRSQLLNFALSEADASPEDLLARLKAFSPEAWAATKTSSHEGWLLVARAHHSAAILYCISTLEKHFPRSSLQELEILRAVHASTLFSVLRQSDTIPGVRMGSLWPLVVAGVEAAREDSSTRSFVGKRFVGLADDLATPLMLEAKEVFERFWVSGKVGWEKCFDRPYAFVL